MQTELAQIISLTSYGNHYLKTGQVTEDYFRYNTVFQHCREIVFKDINNSLPSIKSTETISANNPLDWFQLLKKEGCIQLRLNYRASEKKTFAPEYNYVGGGNGLNMWVIESNFGNYSHYWQKSWQVKEIAPNKKVWVVYYSRVIESFSPTNQQIEIQKTSTLLAETLKELIAFCIQQKLNNWKEIFEKADKISSDPKPNTHYYHHDLIVVNNYSLAVQQLLFSAAASWVFGGMGWWNDMGFKDKIIHEKYLSLSQQLYNQINQSILATINSY